MPSRVYNSILETIGNTPLVRLNKLSEGLRAAIYGKAEYFNPAHSVKDRIALAMIEEAEKSRIIKPGDTIVEPTSGNTGIGLAFVAAVKGYKIILVMPESMTIERRKILKAFGAEIVLTPAAEGMEGAVSKAEELHQQGAAAYIPQQFRNKANPGVHYRTTGPEIFEALQGNIDVFIAAVGTGGTITGVGRYLRERLGSKVRIVAVEPKESPVLSGGKAAPHKIQGIGAGFVPDVLDTRIYDEVRVVSADDAMATSRRLASTEGIFVGISAGANAWVALQIAKETNTPANIVTILCDTGERYLSNPLWDM
nr:cysteine synthase A [Candidatus Sigynarchaeum springense]